MVDETAETVMPGSRGRVTSCNFLKNEYNTSSRET